MKLFQFVLETPILLRSWLYLFAYMGFCIWLWISLILLFLAKMCSCQTIFCILRENTINKFC